MLKKVKFLFFTRKNKEFYKIITFESIARIQAVLAILSLFQILQLGIYLMGTDQLFKITALYALKLIIIFLCIAYKLILSFITRQRPLCDRFAEPIVAFMIFTIIIWSVANTFFSQSITSDISVYMLVIFSVSAAVRVRPWLILLIFLINYTSFVMGMPHFQSNPVYLKSHVMNGFILNFVAASIAIMFYIYSYRDFLDKEDINSKNKELAFLAQHDGLTGLYNHITIHEILETKIVAAKHANEPLSLILLDIDFFKSINDNFGHKTGDNVIRSVAEHIVRNTRQKDFAGRYGGDEFMIILPGANLDFALTIAKRLQEELKMIKFDNFTLTLSGGVVELSGDSANELVERADRLLYQSKGCGRNSINTN